jgi:hypothetical protein
MRIHGDWRQVSRLFERDDGIERSRPEKPQALNDETPTDCFYFKEQTDKSNGHMASLKLLPRWTSTSALPVEGTVRCLEKKL